MKPSQDTRNLNFFEVPATSTEEVPHDSTRLESTHITGILYSHDGEKLRVSHSFSSIASTASQLQRRKHLPMTSYTESRSSDPELRRSRTTVGFSLMNLFPSSPLFDKFLGYISVITGVFLVLFVLVGCLLLLPFLIVDFWRKHTGKNKNISTMGGGSRSAIKTLSARSQMYLQKSGGPDHLAPLLLNQISLFGQSGKGPTHWFSKVYLFLARCNFYLTGRIFADQFAVYLEDW